MYRINTALFRTQNGKIVHDKNGTVGLWAETREFGQKFYGEQEYFSFSVEDTFKMETYFTVKYVCQGLRRQLSIRKPFVFAITKDSEVPLICYDDVVGSCI